MSEKNKKNTTIQRIIKDYLNQEKISIYRISKEIKITDKTIKKMLENTDSNYTKNTLQKLCKLKRLKQEDRKEIIKMLEQKKEKIDKHNSFDNTLKKIEQLLAENEILKEKINVLTLDTEIKDDYFVNRKINSFYNELQSNSLLITKLWDFNENILKEWADVKLLLDINERSRTLKMEKGLKSISKTFKDIAEHLDKILKIKDEEKEDFIVIEEEEEKMDYDIDLNQLDFSEIENKINALALIRREEPKEILKKGILTNIALETLPNYKNYTSIFQKITGTTQARMIKGVEKRIPKQLEQLFEIHDINRLNEDILDTAENLVIKTFDSVLKNSGNSLKKRYKEAIDDVDFLYINLRLAVKIVAEKLRSENIELSNLSLQYIIDGIKKEKNNIAEIYIEAYIKGDIKEIEIARNNYREKMEKMLKNYYQSLNFSYEHTLKIGGEQQIVQTLGKDFFDSITSVLLNDVSLKIKQNHNLQLKFTEF